MSMRANMAANIFIVVVICDVVFHPQHVHHFDNMQDGIYITGLPMDDTKQTR